MYCHTVGRLNERVLTLQLLLITAMALNREMGSHQIDFILLHDKFCFTENDNNLYIKTMIVGGVRTTQLMKSVTECNRC